jgi:hypothetical protein
MRSCLFFSYEKRGENAGAQKNAGAEMGEKKYAEKMRKLINQTPKKNVFFYLKYKK